MPIGTRMLRVTQSAPPLHCSNGAPVGLLPSLQMIFNILLLHLCELRDNILQWFWSNFYFHSGKTIAAINKYNPLMAASYSDLSAQRSRYYAS